MRRGGQGRCRDALRPIRTAAASWRHHAATSIVLPATCSPSGARHRTSSATTGIPAVICASVNDEIVHGIPDERPLHDGDVLSIDCGAIVDGWHGDAAFTMGVGNIDAEPRNA